MEKKYRRPFLFLYRDSGSILIISIWILTCFSILSVGLYRVVSSQLRLAQNLEARICSAAMAEAAYRYAKVERSQDDTAKYDTLAELRTKQEKELGNGSFTYTIVDEESKININSSSADTLARLPSLDQDSAQAIIESPLRPFHVKEELLLIDGISEEAYDACKEFITVHTDGDININTATPVAFKALGFDDDLIAVIEEFRAGPDNKEGTKDDGVFEDNSEIINSLRSYIGLSEAQEAKLLQVMTQRLISTQSKNYSLNIETRMFGKSAMKYIVVMDKSKIKQWTER